MADVNFKPNWSDASTSCQKCKMFQVQGDKTACVPPDKNFDQAYQAFGPIPPSGHCDYFAPKA